MRKTLKISVNLLSATVVVANIAACGGQKLPPVVSTDNVAVVDNQSIAKTKTATNISVSNPTNKAVKQIKFHTRPKKDEELLEKFKVKVFGEPADAYKIKFKNLSTGEENEGTFPKDKDVIAGELVINENYEVVSQALLKNEVIANAVINILVTDTMSDVYLDYIPVENTTAFQTRETTIITGGVLDKRVQAVKPKPTLSLAPDAVMIASIEPTVGYPSGTPFKLLFENLRPNAEYKVSYGNNPEFTNESSNHQFSDSTGKILLEYSSSSYNVGHFYYKVSDLSTGEFSVTSMEIVPKP